MKDAIADHEDRIAKIERALTGSTEDPRGIVIQLIELKEAMTAMSVALKGVTDQMKTMEHWQINKDSWVSGGKWAAAGIGAGIVWFLERGLTILQHLAKP